MVRFGDVFVDIIHPHYPLAHGKIQRDVSQLCGRGTWYVLTRLVTRVGTVMCSAYQSECICPLLPCYTWSKLHAWYTMIYYDYIQLQVNVCNIVLWVYYCTCYEFHHRPCFFRRQNIWFRSCRHQIFTSVFFPTAVTSMLGPCCSWAFSIRRMWLWLLGPSWKDGSSWLSRWLGRTQIFSNPKHERFGPPFQVAFWKGIALNFREI